MDVVADVLSWLTAPEQWSGPDAIPVRTLQHLYYSLLATAIATAIALPIGVGIVPVLVALTALAIPPIVTNSYVGMRSVDPDVREAAEGMGMRGRQVLWRGGHRVAGRLLLRRA